MHHRLIRPRTIHVQKIDIDLSTPNFDFFSLLVFEIGDPWAHAVNRSKTTSLTFAAYIFQKNGWQQQQLAHLITIVIL